MKYPYTLEIKQQYNILKMTLLHDLGCLENVMELGVLQFNIQQTQVLQTCQKHQAISQQLFLDSVLVVWNSCRVCVC